MVTKGFMRIFSLSSAAGDEVATFGEISNYSRTFARYTDRYHHADYPDFEYLSFYSKDGEGNRHILDDSVKERIFKVTHWLYNQAVDNNIPEESEDLAPIFFEEFDTYDYRIEQVGPIITEDGFSLPAFMHMRFLDDEGEDLTQVFVWFVDDIFQTTFDEYEIEIIPPTDHLDDIFDRPGEVERLAEERNQVEFFERIEQRRRGSSPTYIRTERAEFHHPEDLEHTFYTYWTFIIYGQAGNHFDAILHELERYIREHSDYSLDQWRELAPDFFFHTEFLLIPLWDQMAIENNNIDAGIYSPIVKPLRAYKKAKKFTTLDVYDDEHIEHHLSILPSAYKNLPIVIIGNPQNQQDLVDIEDKFPDYLMISTTSSEFSRMSTNTQDWVVLLNKLIKEAEVADEYNFLPDGMIRMYRDDYMYILTEHNDFRFLILSKMSYLEHIENDED